MMQEEKKATEEKIEQELSLNGLTTVVSKCCPPAHWLQNGFSETDWQ